MLSRHHSERIDRGQQDNLLSDLSLKKNSKKSIHKPSQSLELIDKVQLLREKN